MIFIFVIFSLSLIHLRCSFLVKDSYEHLKLNEIYLYISTSHSLFSSNKLMDMPTPLPNGQ